MAFLTEYKRRSPTSFYIILSLAVAMAWVNFFIFNMETSPLLDVLPGLPATNGMVQPVFLMCTAAGTVVQLLFFSEEMNRRVLPGIGMAWMLSSAALTFLPGGLPLYVMDGVMGVAFGVYLMRLINLLIFYIPQVYSARYIVFLYIVGNGLYTLLHLDLLGRLPWLNYGVAALLAAASLFFYFNAKPDAARVRQYIPEKKLAPGDIFWVVLLFGGLYFCLAGIKNVARPNFAEIPWLYYYQLIPNVLAMVFLALWGYKMRLSTFLTVLIVLLGLSFCVFQASGGSAAGRLVFDALMEPAYYFIDVIFFVTLARLAHTFGRSLLRVRLLFGLFAGIVGFSYGVSALVFADGAVDLRLYSVVYVVVVALLALVPVFCRKLPFLFNEEVAAPEQDTGRETAPPGYRFAPVTADELRVSFSGYANLTTREAEVLLLMSNLYDNDVIAVRMGISKNTVSKYITAIYTKLNVVGRRELLAAVYSGEDGPSTLTLRETEILNRLADGQERKEPVKDLFSGKNLTPREAQVVSLLLRGLTMRQISAEIGISYHTVNTYCSNLYKKLNVNSKTELFAQYGVVRARPDDAPGLDA